jgi:hypothetical protein
MTQSVVVHTDLPDSAEAGAFLGQKIAEAFGGDRPDALVLFAPPRYEYPALLRAIHDTCRPELLVGGSSIGGFTNQGYLDAASTCAVALRSNDMRFVAGVGRQLNADPARAAREMVSGFEGVTSYEYVYRSAIVLVDAIVGLADNFIDEVILSTGGAYQLFGGGAADPRMTQSHLFYGTEVLSNGAVGLEILSNKPLGVGLSQGWRPISDRMRVTEVAGYRLVSLNGIAATEVFQAHAEATRQNFDRANPMPFFLDNIIGVESGEGYKFRVPIAANEDGSVSCAAEVPMGATVRIMATTAKLASDAADAAVRRARSQIGDWKPQLAIFFDCLASQARLQLGFGFDPRILGRPLETANYVGFSTCGQVVRCEGEFNGFQNCTAVVCVIPE